MDLHTSTLQSWISSQSWMKLKLGFTTGQRMGNFWPLFLQTSELLKRLRWEMKKLFTHVPVISPKQLHACTHRIRSSMRIYQAGNVTYQKHVLGRNYHRQVLSSDEFVATYCEIFPLGGGVANAGCQRLHPADWRSDWDLLQMDWSWCRERCHGLEAKDGSVLISLVSSKSFLKTSCQDILRFYFTCQPLCKLRGPKVLSWLSILGVF